LFFGLILKFDNHYLDLFGLKRNYKKEGFNEMNPDLGNKKGIGVFDYKTPMN
jgi:hypothetical protein